MKFSNGKYAGLSLLVKPLILILFLAGLSIGAFFALSQHYINTLFENVEKKYRQDLMNIVSVARHAVEPVLVRVRSGEITREEAIGQIRKLVRTMTYEDQEGKNYIFMSSYSGVMLVQPFEPAKELTNQWNLRDAKGLYIIRELVKSANAHPNGSFVRYYYHLPGIHAMQEKLAYVVGLPELECYIGTGMYMERSIREQRAILTNARYASLWLFFAMFIPISVAAIVILRRNRSLLVEIRTRRKAEENVGISEAKYRSIFENIGKGIYQSNPDGGLISANPAFARICGYESPGKMLEDNISTGQLYFDPSERVALLALINEKEHIENYELRIKRKDGSLIWGSVSSRVVKDEQGNILYYEGSLEDINARKEGEDELRLNSRRTQVLLQLGGMTEAPLQEITDFALEEAVRLTNSEIGYLAFLNEEESVLTMHSWSRSAMVQCAITDKPIRYRVVDTGLWGEAVRQRRAIMTNDYTAPDPLKKGLPAGHIRILRHMNVPIFHGQKIAIVAGVGNKKEKYAQADIEQLTLLMQGMLRLIERKQAEEKLRLSEEKFAKVFIMAPEMIGITRLKDGLISDVNLGFEEITGWKRTEAMGQTSFDINFWGNPEDRAGMVDDLQSGKDVIQREIIFRHKNGSLRTGIYSARLIQIGAEPFLLFVMQDITQRKETEKALEEKEERLSSITRNIPGAVFQLYATDKDNYHLTYVSERMMQFLNLPEDINKAFPVFLSSVYEADRGRLLASIREAIATAGNWNFEGRIVQPAGGITWFQGVSTPTRHEDKLIFNGIFLDISERKQAEEKSRQSEEKFTKIFMTAPDCIAISRMSDGMIMDANMGFEEFTGWKRDEVVGKTSQSINFWADSKDRTIMIDELKAGRDVLHREFQFRRKDGTLRLGVYSARSIEIAGDQCLVFILNDVTDRRLLEEERRKLEQQLSQSQKLDAIGQLASGVAHDFNNILMGIQGNAALMQMDYPPEHPHYQKLSLIEEHIKRGANLTRQLLGFAREGKYEVRTLSLNDLIRKVAQFFLEMHKEIEADYQLQKDLYPVEADSGQIEQVLLNMFINAGHAMPGGGFLHIRTDNVTLQEIDTAAFQLKPGNFAKISISDTGIGMDAETLKRIFEPFFTTRLKDGGSGLGLASAYGIIRNHGGAIKVYSEPGSGSTFNIFLPSSRQKVQAEESYRHGRLVSGKGVILLVDDEPMILGSASEMLKMLGYTVYQAASGQEAVAVYAEQRDKIDLVLLDMVMPGMSGSQVLKIMKDLNPNVRVILSSGYSMQGEVQKVMETGCSGFIQKPYSFAELSNIVHQALNPPPSERR